MLLKITKILFLLMIFSLSFMQPYQYVYERRVPFTDLIFLVTFAFWMLALVFRQTRFHWHKFFWLSGVYLAVMILSGVFSLEPRTSFIKLLGETYLLSLPVLTFNLLDCEKFTKRVVYAWLAGTFVAVLVGILTVILFYLAPNYWLLGYTLFYVGSLPPGHYPRIQSTFANGNMLCNYFSVSLMLLLAAEKVGWLDKKVFYPLLAGILFCSLFTISPGLGGIALCFGIWYWVYLKAKNKYLARAGLITGLFIAFMFIVAVVIAPNTYPTAPFYVDVPIIERRIEPSVRVLTALGAFNNFVKYPILGMGTGLPACDVHYLDLSGHNQPLDDAHNLLLNVAAQQGILGVLAICAIMFYLARRLFPLIPSDETRHILRIGCAIAFTSAFVYQGLSGSFEDARHLWVLIGLFLVPDRMIEESGKAEESGKSGEVRESLGSFKE